MTLLPGARGQVEGQHEQPACKLPSINPMILRKELIQLQEGMGELIGAHVQIKTEGLRERSFDFIGNLNPNSCNFARSCPSSVRNLALVKAMMTNGRPDTLPNLPIFEDWKITIELSSEPKRSH